MELEFKGYVESIDRFTFREKAALTIPKRVREKAYSLAIDIEIVSVAKAKYKSYKSEPANSHYGYAVVVDQDHCRREIELSLPRQRIYYERVVEAFDAWYALYLSHVVHQTLASIANGLLVPIGNQLGLQSEPTAPTCPTSTKWIELPVREVYVKADYGTQFRVEISYYSPVSVLYGECDYLGFSGQEDGDKDDGLPENSGEHTSGDPSSPYAGLPSSESLPELGDYANLKGEGINLPNRSNAPVTTPSGYPFEGDGQIGSDTGQGRISGAVYYVEISWAYEGDPPSLERELYKTTVVGAVGYDIISGRTNPNYSYDSNLVLIYEDVRLRGLASVNGGKIEIRDFFVQRVDGTIE